MAVGYRDYYEVLGVPRGASADEIRSAYRRLARENHPDVSKDQDASARFSEISEAYEVLRDPEKRAQYDRLGRDWRAGQDVSGTDGFRGRDGGDVRFDFGTGGDADFSDFFESLFGGGRATSRGGRRRQRPGSGGDGFALRGGDHEATIELTLEEAARGGRRRFTLDDGRDYEVTIPPGVRDGQRIRLAGEGAPGVGGGPSGDLFLRVRLRPHPRFRVDGRDLEVDLPVAPWEAALGARVPVPTLDGDATVKVPGGSSSGRRLRLAGQGMPGPGGERGDLYAIVKIVVQRRLRRDEKRAYQQLAEASERFDPRSAAA
ncbi:DnaJ C-terminal domain-containing protein [Conexibacter woesei]|uniref:DnaJ C-terminal domain-containing protein n=1 Tax=Conexibacter woesei TaxID=191495 RepID=UPI00047D3BA9|nr:DnaJ C-terminal domain-containing protein [Conexibacter woesei]